MEIIKNKLLLQVEVDAMATKKKHLKNKPINKIVDAFSIKDIKRADAIRTFCGIALVCLSIFMGLAFVSYLVIGHQDQSTIESLESPLYIGSEQDAPRTVHNVTGSLGAKTADYFINKCFGLSSFFIPLFLLFCGLHLLHAYRINPFRKFVNFAFMMIWFSVALSFFVPDRLKEELIFSPGGGHGDFICQQVTELIGVPGLFIALVLSALAYLIYVSSRTITIIHKITNGEYFRYLLFKLPKRKTDAEKESSTEDTPSGEDELPNMPLVDTDVPAPEPASEPTTNSSDLQEQNNNDGDKSMEIKAAAQEEKARGDVLQEKPYDPRLDLEFYKFPTLSLLKKYDLGGLSIDTQEQKANEQRIRTILRNFGVEIDTIKATIGPTITLYEITPAVGVKISKIRNLEDDIALSLSAMGIRIIAPIPGRGTIGIEVPNRKPQIVPMESILNTRKFQECDMELPMALGKTISNEVFIADLAKMPHLLVAGATGQGKSVGLNAIITSLLYKKHPSEMKLVLVDPKQVEFSVYKPLENYFMAEVEEQEGHPIITDSQKVIKVLKSLCQEMDNRYSLLNDANVRNIKEYNKRFVSRQLNPERGHRYLPYIVIIIDEFGDLIMTAGKEVEMPIARIAQKARAVGMHMIIATQRPTTNIITGTIKANFPARMAFKVASQIDSRTILDQSGANQLVGKGDMLFLAGTSIPTRVQCAYVSTSEVVAINKFISDQQGFLEPYLLPEVSDDAGGGGGGAGMEEGGRLDPLFEDVAKLVIRSQSGSTSLIQRKFSIGYARAGRLMDQLEKAGVVGGSQGSKPREVLMADESQLQTVLDGYKTN